VFGLPTTDFFGRIVCLFPRAIRSRAMCQAVKESRLLLIDASR
jgi:hypothetical protein